MANINVVPTKKEETSKKTSPNSLREDREDAVNGVFQLVGLGCIMIGNYADAGAIDMHAPPVSEEIAEMAESNAPVAKVVDSLLQVGPYAGLVAALSPLIMQLLVNHNVLDAEKISGQNVVKPEVLESKVKTQLAQQAAEVMQAQIEAERELAATQAKLEEMRRTQNGKVHSES